mgnify:CR=1 FL=1
MKKFLILFMLCLFNLPAFAVNDEEIIIGICSAFMPMGNNTQQVVCTTHGNKQICELRYKPEIIRNCKNMFVQMGILKPGENPKVLLQRGY